MWEIFQLHICAIEKVLHWLISLTQCSVCRRNKPIIYTYVWVWKHVVGILRGKACASAKRLLLPWIGWICGANLVGGQLPTGAMQRQSILPFCNKQTNKRTPRQLEESDDELLSYASQTLSKRNPQTSGFLEQGKAVGVLSGESREIIKFRQQLLTIWVMPLIDITYAMITFRTLATA